VRIVGGATKLDWGGLGATAELELRTGALDRVLEHNAGDLTAALQAGVPLATAQAVFAAAGQRLALDPPRAAGATIGGVVATGDCGPLRHRYGAPRDLVLGITVALSDGTIARAGGKVIKNVAGYDLAKLFAGSFGTLGVILAVNVRLHPLPPTSATATASSSEPAVIAAAARRLASAPLELEALDVAWRDGRGEILAQAAGAQASARARAVAALMRGAGLEHADVFGEDAELWQRQRAGQRATPGRAIVRTAARPSQLPAILRASEACGAALVARAALGVGFAELDPEAVGAFRSLLPAGAESVLLDAPAALRATEDPWGLREGPALELMRSVKRRFDPAGVCNPGLFVGGI
jgi:glycolate oxidase FAD binding subunit